MKRTLAVPAALFTLLVLMFSELPVQAAGTRAVRLPGGAALQIDGAAHVSAVGDVNDDGLADVLLSLGGRGQSPDSGRVHVVFGGTDQDHIVLDRLGSHGFVIEGAKPRDAASVIAPAGDVNGDGLDDILIGAPDAPLGGAAYVVFGKADNLPVHLALFDAGLQGPLGFRIWGNGGFAGRQVTGVGDINQDGYDDVAVAAPFRATTYVVFGKPDTLPVFLGDIGSEGREDIGYPIYSHRPDIDDGLVIAGPGDMNGDGIPDIALAVLHADADEGLIDDYGRPTRFAYVVYSSGRAEAVDAQALWEKGEGRGFIIHNASIQLSPAGDFDGDGLADLLVGDLIVFGKKGMRAVDYRRRPGAGGLRIGGRPVELGIAPVSIWSSEGGQDVNGDGIDDLVVGTPGAAYNGPYSGAAWVVFGSKQRRKIRLTSLGGRGFRIDGPGPDKRMGRSAALLGDFTGNGLSDIALGVGPSSFVLEGRR
jgi:hypothetical protein